MPRAPPPPNAGVLKPAQNNPAPPASEPRDFLSDIQKYSLNTLKKVTTVTDAFTKVRRLRLEGFCD